MKLVLFFVGVYCLLGNTSAQDNSAIDVKPGIRLRVTKAGLKYAADREIAGLIKRLRGRDLNDVSGQTRAFGNIKYKLSEIRNQKVDIPVSSFITVPGLGLCFRASQIDVAFRGKWWYKQGSGWFSISDSGRFTLEGVGISFDLTAAVGRSSDGRPTIATDGCTASVRKVNIKFQGGASWLYNMFSNTLEKKIEEKLQKMMCSAAETAIIEKATKGLKTFPVKKKVNNAALIDYSFIRDPSFTSQYLDAFLKGKFESTSSPTPVLIAPVPFGNSPSDSKMLYFWLSDYTLNTAALVFHKAGLLTKTIRGKNQVADSAFTLNTKSFQLGLNKLYQLYPDLPMVVKLLTTAAPTFYSDVNGMTVTISGNATFYVISNQTDSVPVITLSARTVCGLNLGIHKSNLTVHVNSIKFNLQPIQSQIGDINMETIFLQMIVNQVLGKEILNELNKYGDVGFPLPTVDKLSFINTQVTSGKNFTLLAADMEYTPA